MIVRIFATLALLCSTCGVVVAQSPKLEAPAIPDAPLPVTVEAGAHPSAPVLERPSVAGEPTEVRIGIYVIDIDNIDSANQNFSASVYYEARWNDPALRHPGPGPRIVETANVWTPRLTIVNQQQSWNAFPSFVEINPDGEVVYRQKTWGWFSQPLDLRDFPFDRQLLGIHIVAVGLRQSDVSMTPLVLRRDNVSGIAKKFSMADFEVVSVATESRAYVPFEGVAGPAGFILEVTVKRKPAYYFWKLIFPLCLIIAISWVPLWVDPKEVSTNIGIAATSFLTLVAYLFATAVLLPRVEYVTRMDLFILLSMLMIFIGLVQTVVTCWYVKTTAVGSIEQVVIWSRAVYPFILLAVLGIAFAW